jgi:hypothetical protein
MHTSPPIEPLITADAVNATAAPKHMVKEIIIVHINQTRGSSDTLPHKRQAVTQTMSK